MATIAQDAEKFESVAGHVIYLAEYGGKRDAAALAAERANSFFYRIHVASTLTPTEALVMAGCIDAQFALERGEDLDIDKMVAAYWEADKAEYIEKTMLRALSRFVGLLDLLDSGLAEFGIPSRTRAQWVRRGLDFPPGDGIAHHIQRTAVDRAGWDVARERATHFLEYVKGLPYELRSGQVDPESVLSSVAFAVGLPE